MFTIYNTYRLYLRTYSSASAIVLAYPLAQSKDYYNNSVNISMYFQAILRFHKNLFLHCCYLIPIPMVPAVHLIKKLTLYARRTGTDVLHAADRRAMGTDTGVASATLSDRSRSKMVVLVR